MLIDGKKIARDILAQVKNEVALLPDAPKLTVFTCAPNFETQKFLHLKQKRAEEVGIEVEVVFFPENTQTLEIVEKITSCLSQTDGIIVQLPFPAHIDIQTVLHTVPTDYDVDALFYDGETNLVLPPVVGAIDVISKLENIDWEHKNVVIVGQGRLVGLPSTIYAKKLSKNISIIEKETVDANNKISQADILILGAGVPGLIKAENIKEGVMVFDASTSEEGGMLVGDASADVVEKALFVTPVPGGIGPITIAVLLQNLVSLAKSK